LFDFSLQIFPHKDHKDLFWCDVQKKRSCVFLWFWRIEVKGWAQFGPDFRQIITFVDALAPPASYTTAIVAVCSGRKTLRNNVLSLFMFSRRRGSI